MSGDFVASLKNVRLHYRKTEALRDISLEIPAGCMAGLIGPDGVGKSSMLSLIAGAKRIQQGEVQVLGGDMRDKEFRRKVCPRIAYMPQGLGKNLYMTLSVQENIEFFGRLFAHDRREMEMRMERLLRATGLASFKDRPAGKLSGGMKQKLGLCCALIHEPDFLLLDEPTTGVDPLSRRQFWELIEELRKEHQEMSVLVATAYMEEAERFSWLAAMNAGQVLATGTPQELMQQTSSKNLDAAFIALLPEENKQHHRDLSRLPKRNATSNEIAIEAHELTMRFGNFTAVDNVSFEIKRGEIFGFLGSNGCGKTTTMKMLTGLLEPSEGDALLFGHPVDPRDMAIRSRVGYMTQAFSLYQELTVEQNLVLHAKLFGMPADEIPARVEVMCQRFGLSDILDVLPESLPLGQRQRLSLAVAMIHKPDLLILDEPTSGVDPIARDSFWEILIHLAREEKVTLFISTHFMNEAERCDRISLMHAGKVLVTDTPENLMQENGGRTLEDAFIDYLSEVVEEEKRDMEPLSKIYSYAPVEVSEKKSIGGKFSEWAGGFFQWKRMLGYLFCEGLELRRDPVRLVMAALGSVILMLVLGYGMSMDVEDLRFAVMDRDQSTASRDYISSLSGSRYFLEQIPILSDVDMDHRMRSGELSLAIEIPSNFAVDMARGRPVEIGAWIDGSMPSRAETIRGYVQGIHLHWMETRLQNFRDVYSGPGLTNVEIRYRYNPDVLSTPAMVPAVIPLLLLLLPAILTALSVVREKELGSIVNLYVTPVTRLEFFFGKQIPYLVLGMLNFFLLTVLAIYAFKVPLTGSLLALSVAAFLYLISSTAMGMIISAFVKSQIAALFGTTILTILPAVTFSGILNPVSALEGTGRVIGEIYPTTHFLTIARGTFSKALGFDDLVQPFLVLLITAPVLVLVGVLLLRKQEK